MTTISSSALIQQAQQKPLGAAGAAPARTVDAGARSASDFARIFEALNAEQDGKIGRAETAAAPSPAQGPWETVRMQGDTTPAQARDLGGSRPKPSAEPTLMDMTQTLSTRLMAQILGGLDAAAA